MPLEDWVLDIIYIIYAPLCKTSMNVSNACCSQVAHTIFMNIARVVCVAMLVPGFLRPRSVCARGCEIQGESPNRIRSNIAQLRILEVTLWNLKFKSLRLSDSHPLHTVCFSGIFTNGSWLWHLGAGLCAVCAMRPGKNEVACSAEATNVGPYVSKNQVEL